MANLRIKGIDDDLYARLKSFAASENRSINQQILFILERCLAERNLLKGTRTPAQILLDLSGSWKDGRSADQIVNELKVSRKSHPKIRKGF